MKKTVLRKYAKLIATVGGNVQKGQEVIIQSELNCPEFVTMVVDECYKAGAEKVEVEWSHQPITKLHYRHRSVSVLSKMQEWEIEKYRSKIDILPVLIWLTSEDPDGLKGVNQEKVAKASQARYSIIKPMRDQIENRYQWCIAAVPGAEWAKKVFPNERTSVAIEKLWRAILTASRVDPDGNDDPCENWAKHNENLKNKYNYLNSLNIESLEYHASNGTDFRVGLIENCNFMGGGETALGSGIFYNPNIPSEEVFTSPMKGKAEGIVYSSKPLSYQGKLIENFSVRFENGKAVEVHAEKNEDLLKKMITMDEGAAYLGECALVPYSSPINQSGIIFYNTLFDENAACHLALGTGFDNCLADFENLTHEQCMERGVNNSMIHVDFMIGTKDLSVIAHTRDGKSVQLFKDGEWAF